MPTGTIKRVVVDRGFGFVADDSGTEYFFHFSGLGEGLLIETLQPGQRVNFETERSDRGPRATRITLAE
jgi:cold shock protein